MRRLSFFAILICSSAVWSQEQPAPDPAQPEITGIARGSLNPAKRGLSLPATPKVMVIPIKDGESTKYGMMDDWQATFLERRLRQAQKENYDLVILDIDTNGGVVDSVERMNKAIAKCPVPVVAFVTGKAFSAGAMLSLACKAIVMAPRTQIGGAKVVSAFGDLNADMRQKVDAMARAMVTGLAETNKYPIPIAVGMVDSNAEVYEVSGERERFMTGREVEEAERKQSAKVSIVRQIKKKDEILTLTATEAVNVGLASGVAADIDEVIMGLNIAPTTVDVAGVSPNETAARFVSHPLWRVLLVLIGLVALFWELKAPGHGIGYIIFAFCLGIFFWLQIFSNNAGIIEIALFAIGALLLGIEVFLLAGFGFAGFAGIAMIIASIVLSFVPEGITIQSLWDGTASPQELARLRAGLSWAALTLLTMVVVTVTALLRGAKLPGLSRLALKAEVPAPALAVAAAGEETVLSDPKAQAALVGQVGTVETVLRPSGKVRLGGKTYDAVSEGSFLEAGSKVVVLRVSGNSLVVRAV